MTEPAMMKRPRAEHIVYGELLSAEETHRQMVRIAADWMACRSLQPIIVRVGDDFVQERTVPTLPANINAALTESIEQLYALREEFEAVRARASD